MKLITRGLTPDPVPVYKGFLLSASMTYVDILCFVFLLAWGPVIFKTFIQIHQLRHGQPCLYLYISKQLVNSAIHVLCPTWFPTTWSLGCSQGLGASLASTSSLECFPSHAFQVHDDTIMVLSIYFGGHDVMPCAPFFGKQVAPE